MYECERDDFIISKNFIVFSYSFMSHLVIDRLITQVKEDKLG
jgi:hypothetical protein